MDKMYEIEAAFRKDLIMQAVIPQATEEACARVVENGGGEGVGEFKLLERLFEAKLENVSWGQICPVLLDVLGGEEGGE